MLHRIQSGVLCAPLSASPTRAQSMDDKYATRESRCWDERVRCTP